MGRPRLDAVVVGAGPNGLAAAVTLAQHGHGVHVLEGADDIGGGTRSRHLTVPGVLHDTCSAIHPLASASPFLTSLPLARCGLEWRWPEIQLAHPLDGDRAGVLVRSLHLTAAGLGPDEGSWRRTFGPSNEHFWDLASEIFRPLAHVPRHPITLARFGSQAVLSATRLARRFSTDEARALFAGAAAHITAPLDRPATASVGLVLIAAGHTVGWPVAVGGSQKVTAALAQLLVELGGTIETGQAA